MAAAASDRSPSGARRDNRIDLLGLPLDTRTWANVDAWLREVLAAADGRCRHLVTLNPEYVMAARRDPALAAAIWHADLVLADGVGVVLAARWLDGERVDRITGVALTEHLASLSQQADAPLFLLGAGPGVAADARTKLRTRYPDARVAGVWDGGSPRLEDDAETIRRIASSGARVVLVAYGAPAQVHWIARNQVALGEAGIRLAIGVGGAFDFLSGRVKRAPAPVRRLGLEWLYRLVHEPWRWRRQLALPRFALAVIGQRVARQRPRI